MKTDDLITSSWRMVFRNWRRYKAVIVLIALGTLGFILIRTMGDAVENKVSEDLELIGEATVLKVRWDDRKTPHHPGEYYIERHVRRIAAISGVQIISVVRRTDRTEKIQYANKERKQLRVSAVDDHFWKTQSATLGGGRLISLHDVQQLNRVCVVGKDIVNELFDTIDPVDPVGKQITVNGHWYQVIGTLTGVQDDHISKSIFIPLSLAPHHLSPFRQVTEFYVRVDHMNNVKAVSREIKELLKVSYPQNPDGVSVQRHLARLERVQFIMFLVRLFSYAALVGVFAMGKIGLTNVMLSSVRDRTREIGLRKAMGASDAAVRAQFMLESLIVSSSSGLVGVLAGVALIFLMQRLMGVSVSSHVMSSSILLDFFLTLLIGVAAGLYPSREASRMDIVMAMRFE